MECGMEHYYIGYDGIRGSKLSWRDLEWGLEYGFINFEDVIKFSDSTLNESSDGLHIDLSTCGKDDASCIQAALNALVLREENCEVDKTIWMYLILEHLYYNRLEYVDPLERVEWIYADFDYQEEVASFVRYMPPAGDYDPRSHTFEENIAKMYKNWKAYLERNYSKYRF